MKNIFVVFYVCLFLKGCFLFPNDAKLQSSNLKIAPMGKSIGKVGLDDSTFTTICQNSMNQSFDVLLHRLDSCGYKTANINENIIDMGLTGAMIELSFNDGQVDLIVIPIARLISDSDVAKVLVLEEYSKYQVDEITVHQKNSTSKNFRSRFWP